MKNIDFENLPVEELAKLISRSSPAYQALKDKCVLRTKNVVGELGEYYAINHYKNTCSLPDLTLTDTGSKNIDAKNENGETYSIKTRSVRKGPTSAFWNPRSIEKNDPSFDYLIIVIIDDSYALDMIMELTWNDFFKYKKYNKRMDNYNISITKTLMDNVTPIYESS